MTVTESRAPLEHSALVRELGAVPFRISSLSRSLALSPDGATVATVGGHVVQLIDAANGATLRVLELGGDERFELCAFASDGVLLFVAGWSATVLVLDARTLSLVRTLDTGQRGVHALASCPGAAHLLFTGGFDQHAALWDMHAGRIVCELPHWEHSDEALKPYVHSAVFSRDGARLVTVTYQGADLWEVPSGTHLGRVADTEFCPAGVAFSPDGEDLFVGNNVGRVALVNPRTGTFELERDALGSRRSVHSMFVTPDNESLVCCAEDGGVHVLSPTSLKLQRTVSGVGSLGTGAALAPDGDTLYLNDERGAIIRISVSEGTIERPSVSGGCQHAAFLDDDTVVAVHHYGSLSRGSLRTGELQCTRGAQVWSTALSSDGTKVALSGTKYDGMVTTILDTRTWKVVASSPLSGVTAVADDGTVCVASERAVFFGDQRTRVDVPEVRQHARVRFGPGGSLLVALSGAEVVRIDVASRSVRDVAKVSKANAIAIDALGRVALALGTKITLLGDEANKSAPEVFAFKGSNISSLATTLDGALVAGGTHDGKLLLARRGEPKSCFSLCVARGSIDALAFSKDGAMLVVGGSDPELRVFSVKALLDAAPKPVAKSRAAVDDEGDGPKAPRAAAKSKASAKKSAPAAAKKGKPSK
jgi:WD40 repeat protein